MTPADKTTNNLSTILERCKALGRAAGEKGNPPVGAVLVKNNEIFSEAAEVTRSKNDITCHAEIEAIRIAVKKTGNNDLSDCTLFTTHEPCVMCSYVIRFHKIKKVVFLHEVEYLGGATSSMPLLTTLQVPPYWGSPPEVVKVDEDFYTD